MLPIGSQGKVCIEEWLDCKVSEQWTVNVGDLEIESSVAVEAEDVTVKFVFLLFRVQAVAHVAYSFKVRQVESVVDSNSAIFE